MERKRRTAEYLIAFYESTYPDIRLLAIQRFNTGKNLFDSKTHRLRPPVRDRSEAAAILLVVEALGIENGRTVQYSADERKVLNKVGLVDV